jgi:HSP20 family protein
MALTGFDHPMLDTMLRGWPFHAALLDANNLSENSSGRWMKPIHLDVAERDTGFELKADIPGVDKNDIKLSVDGNVLSISVEKAAQQEERKEEEGGVKWHRVERSTSYSRRAIRMPDSADLTHVTAKYQDGVLQMTIPKTERARPHAIQVS